MGKQQKQETDRPPQSAASPTGKRKDKGAKGKRAREEAAARETATALLRKETAIEAAEAALELTVGRDTLEETPGRVLQFLRAAGTVRPILGALGARGYSGADHAEGWRLLQAVAGYDEDTQGSQPVDVRIRDALLAVDAWDEDGFLLVSASLRRRHPAQFARVMSGLAAAKGTAAVLSVSRLLERLDALEASDDAEDRAALATLATRGLDTAERTRLRELVTIAQEAATLPTPDPNAVVAAAQQQLRRLQALRDWYEEWSAVARIAVKRRDYRIRLGLAQRRSAAAKAEAGEPAAAAALAEE